MIKISHVSYQYDHSGIPVLNNISLDIHAREYVTLIGPNGCGKTTLVRQLNALCKPDRGVITVDGLDTSVAANHKEIRRRVGMLFQNQGNSIVGMTVEEDIAFGPGNLNWPPSEIRRQVSQMLKSLGLESLSGRAPHTLSGGEKRLVSLAGVLVMNPRYIIFDEPTAYLDTIGRKRVLETMARLHREGIGIIHITHDVNDMADADRLLVMDKGRIIQDGTRRDILRKMAEKQDSATLIPSIMELINYLNRRGWQLPPDIVTVDDAGREIHHLLVSTLRKEDS